MSLDEYKRKRRFSETPEPEALTSFRGGGRFCLQRHAASSLHYDLRLEMGGTLRSWAVPKGPDLVAGSKRLAVQTEDHPVAYLNFEGVIPQGHYGAGTMMVFDIGYWEPYQDQEPTEALEAGELKFQLWGQKVEGSWTLVHTGGKQWLLIKKDDRWCQEAWDPEDFLWSAVTGRTWSEIEEGREAPAPLPRKWSKKAREGPLPLEVEPMLAQVGEPFSDPDWSFELKWDGVRALLACQQQSLRVTSRSGLPLGSSFPELDYLRARMQAESFVLDGELVVLDADGVADFAHIAQRLQVRDPARIAHLARRQTAVLYLFDLLYLDGRDIRDLTWLQRRKLLQQCLRPDSWVRLSEPLPGEGQRIYELIVERGLEGLVAKKHSSTYQAGRSADWLKLKPRHTLDCVVVGYTTPRGRRQGVGSLVLGRYQGGELHQVGRAGSGLTNEEGLAWKERLEPIRVEEPPVPERPRVDTELLWCRPEYVVEVEYGNWTDDGKLRHPVYCRRREDLSPRECGEAALEQGQPLLLRAGRRTVRISNPDKVLFPELKVSKSQLAAYYHRVAPLLLPHLHDRPLSLRRFPDGVEGAEFFQKHPGAGFPEWIRTEPDQGKRRIFCEDTASLLYLANLASIELHATLSRWEHTSSPDGCLLDLDPHKADFETVKRVGRAFREILKEMAWEGYLKTTGSRGLHLFLPLKAGYSFEHSRLLSSVLAQIAEQRHPKLVTLERNPKKRPAGTVYIDVPQNREDATFASVYSVRANAWAGISLPLAWEELDTDVEPRDFTITSVESHLEPRRELWSLEPGERTLEEALPALERMLTT